METGRIYFFTATILKWKRVLAHDEVKDIILDSLKYLVTQKDIILYGYVIMPNHIHLIWKPLTERLQLKFMKFTAQKIKFHLIDNGSPLLNEFVVNKTDRIYQIWQRNPLAIEIKGREMLEQKLDYIHNNPVQGKWLLANDPTEYKFSSCKYYELDESDPLITHYMDDI